MFWPRSRKEGSHATHQVHCRTDHCKLQEAEVTLAKGQTVVQVCKALGVIEQT